jgi:hypothetical protein
MSHIGNPAKPQPDKDKFGPKTVANEGPDKGRADNRMHNVTLGSENDRRGAARARPKAS